MSLNPLDNDFRREDIRRNQDKPTAYCHSTKENVLVLETGKFAAEPVLITDIDAVSRHYLWWMVDVDHQYAEDAIKELQRRGEDPWLPKSERKNYTRGTSLDYHGEDYDDDVLDNLTLGDLPF